MRDITYNENWQDVYGGSEDVESWVMAELTKAFFLARKGKRSTSDEQLFERRLFENLANLRDDILSGTYAPSRGIAFIVKEPVTREIFAAPFRDRVVHHFLYNGIADWWDKRLIYDCYSCRVDKGTLFGVKRLAHHVRSVTENYTKPAYAIKLDIQGYFMSLPRQGLFDRVVWGLDRQFPHRGPHYDIYKQAWKKVIFDDPTEGIRLRGDLHGWDKLPKSKSLFCQPPGKGIVIGNLSSQLLSNIYLDMLDRFIVYDLGYKHYGRYVDDFYLIVTEDEFLRAKKDLRLIKDFVAGIGLTIHPKKIYIQEVSHGIEFLGMVVYPGRIIPGKRIKKNFQKALLDFSMGIRDEDSIISYMGLLKHVNSAKTLEKIFLNAGMDYNF